MSARWIATSVRLTSSVGQWLGAVEKGRMGPQLRPGGTHALGTPMRRCMTSRSEMTISLRRCARAELVDVERMIKIG